MEQRIKLTKTKEEIASCNACLARTYDAKLNVGNRVDTLYDLRIGSTVIRLCIDCLSEIFDECDKAFRNEIE